MYFTIYKTINLINQKYYIGKHITNDPNDKYLGSGKQILDAIKKYGRENFKKDILFIFDNEDDMNTKEQELVTKDVCLSEDSYNMHEGGYGGFLHIRNDPRYKEWCHKGAMNSVIVKNPFIGKQFKKGEERTKQLSLKGNEYRIKNGLSDSHKEKIRIAALKREARKREARKREIKEC